MDKTSPFELEARRFGHKDLKGGRSAGPYHYMSQPLIRCLIRHAGKVDDVCCVVVAVEASNQ